jgi:hypothetical protein
MQAAYLYLNRLLASVMAKDDMRNELHFDATECRGRANPQDWPYRFQYPVP